MNTQRFIGILIGIFLSVGSLFAQDDRYQSALKETFEKLSSGENLQTVTAQFERIAQAEQNKWIPYYYASYYSIVQTFTMKDASLREQLLDHAQSLLDMAGKLQSDSSEIMVVQGFLYIARLQIDPMARGAEYSQMAHGAYDTAIKLNPNNPRSFYMKGVTVLNTPDFFGGGKVPAKPILDKAVQLYASFKPSAPFFPDWGKEDCQKQLAACN